MVPTVPKVFYVPIEGYRHMYRSMMRYFSLDQQQAAALLYPLYVRRNDMDFSITVTLSEI